MENTMPRILIIADPVGQSDAPVLLDERIPTADLARGHSADQLVERIGWALVDADSAEPSAP
jgi:hypothetical protein